MKKLFILTDGSCFIGNVNTSRSDLTQLSDVIKIKYNGSYKDDDFISFVKNTIVNSIEKNYQKYPNIIIPISSEVYRIELSESVIGEL